MCTPASLSKKVVFVVDDEQAIADTLSLILRAAGYSVRTFYDGLSALEHAQEEIPDIVLSDVIMPKMNGIVLARKLREQLPNCRILLISGNAYSATLLAEWQDHGGPELEILPKPCSPQAIIRKLSTIAAAIDDSGSHD